MASTGIGDGIAIPHVRNPVVLQVRGRPLRFVSWSNPSIRRPGLQAGALFFMLITPSTRSHLYLISRLCFALRDPLVKETLVKQDSRENILRELRRMESQFRVTNPTESARAG